jgi:hypothetical protein
VGDATARSHLRVGSRRQFERNPAISRTLSHRRSFSRQPRGSEALSADHPAGRGYVRSAHRQAMARFKFPDGRRSYATDPSATTGRLPGPPATACHVSVKATVKPGSRGAGTYGVAKHCAPRWPICAYAHLRPSADPRDAMAASLLLCHASRSATVSSARSPFAQKRARAPGHAMRARVGGVVARAKAALASAASVSKRRPGR